jgi:gamma-glutamyl:cysteine ligase YbdK (ATP-grasp superfamily)
VSYRYRLRLLEGVGVELEYMIVDRSTLGVRPITNRLLRTVAGRYASEVDAGDLAWSNELALHVLEFKTPRPVRRLHGLAARFADHVRLANERLEALDAMLLPTAMHPWMDPDAEFRRWPHEYGEIYAAFDRIFDCRGHGWANIQSAHLNLSFSDDAEFGRLHAALRLVLPILPALAASSPCADGVRTPYLDTRLAVYRENARRVPSVSGRVVPEPVFTRAEYEDGLLAGIYADLAPLDPEGLLRHEWVNARGCIARFDRGSIEIRVLDVQECPAADLAVAAATLAAVRLLADAPPEEVRAWDVEPLVAVLDATVAAGDRAVIDDARYLRTLGWTGAPRCTAGELWADVLERTLGPDADEWRPALEVILEEGCLARRIAEAVGDTPGRARLEATYRDLARCLAEGTSFHAAV